MATLAERQEAFLKARSDLQDTLRGFNEANRQTLDYLAVRMEQQGSHREEKGNSHNLKKDHFGLGNVVNNPLATMVDIDNLTNPNRYLTPFTFNALVKKLTSEADVLTNPIRNPVPISPVNNATTATQGIVLAADPYRNVYNTFTAAGQRYYPRKYRHFQVDNFNGDYSSPVWERYVEDQDFTVVDIELPMDVELKWRCRDITVDDTIGNWSQSARFKTAQYVVVQPRVEVEGLPGRVPDKPYIRSTAFQTTGTEARHTYTRFELSIAGSDEVIWEKTNAGDNRNEVWLPEHLLEPNRRYIVKVTHGSDLLPASTSVPVTFRTANQFVFEPGKRWFNWGDVDAGIYGEVDQSEFLTTDELLTHTGLTGGVATGWASTSPWLKLSVDGVVMYTPKQPLRTNINRSILAGLGLLNGKTIQLNGWEYTVRLMGGFKDGVSGLSDQPQLLPEKTDGSEYDKIFKMLSLHGTGQYSNHDLGIGPSTKFTLLRDAGNVSPFVATMAGFEGGVTAKDVFAVKHALGGEFASVAWRPVLVRGDSLEVVEPEDELPIFEAYDPFTDTGYLGVFPASDFFTGEELSAEVGLTSGTAFNNDVDWLGFYVGPNATCNKEGGKAYFIYVPQQPHRYNLSWNQIAAAGVARGNVKTVSKGDHTYKVRLLSGGNVAVNQSNYNSTLTHPDHPLQSEWNQLIYRVSQTVPNDVSGAGGPQVGVNWAEFTDSELGFISSNGSYSWCMENLSSDNARRIFRGYSSVAGVGFNIASLVTLANGWRSALVRVLD